MPTQPLTDDEAKELTHLYRVCWDGNSTPEEQERLKELLKKSMNQPETRP